MWHIFQIDKDVSLRTKMLYKTEITEKKSKLKEVQHNF